MRVEKINVNTFTGFIELFMGWEEKYGNGDNVQFSDSN